MLIIFHWISIRYCKPKYFLIFKTSYNSFESTIKLLLTNKIELIVYCYILGFQSRESFNALHRSLLFFLINMENNSFFHFSAWQRYGCVCDSHSRSEMLISVISGCLSHVFTLNHLQSLIKSCGKMFLVKFFAWLSLSPHLWLPITGKITGIFM